MNTKILYSVSGGSREHITTSYLCGADGSLVPPRCIYKGVHNVAQTHLKDLPKDGLSGNKIISQQEIEVQFSTNQLVFYGDKDIFLVIIFIDGASPHISLEAAAFCTEKEIQPWLLKPNMTHILQV